MHHPLALIAATGVIVLVQASIVGFGYSPVLGPDTALAGPDSYMWLLRVEDWWRHGGWYANSFANAPYGDVLHWTRPFDLVLLAGALPLSAVMNFRDALLYWGIAVSPVLQFLSVLALSWGTRPCFSNRAFVFLITLFSIQPAVRSVFNVARPDHHGLLAFLFIAGFVVLLRVVSRTASPRLSGVAGAIGGIGIWVSVESMAAVCAAAAALGLLWVRGGGSHRRDLAHYLTGVAVALGVALALERPPAEWLDQEFDRLSIVHWSIFAFAAAVAALVARVGGDWRVSARIGVAAGALAATAAFILILFPRFLEGPFADMDPRIIEIWLSNIMEVQPLRGASLIFYMGPVIIALLYLLHGLRQAGSERWPARFYQAVLLAIFIPLSVYQARWSVYPVSVAMLAWTGALRAAFRWPGAWRPKRGLAIPMRVPLFWLVLVTPVALGAAVMGGRAESEFAPDSEICRWPPVVAALRDPAISKSRILTLVGFIHQGPEIMYRTGHRAVGAPYHRNARGILDTHAILTARDPNDARDLLYARSVDYLIFCRDSAESRYYKALNKNNFYSRLYDRRLPEWLEDVPVPAGNRFQLFRVVPRRGVN